jgi:hypothetical protein
MPCIEVHMSITATNTSPLLGQTATPGGSGDQSGSVQPGDFTEPSAATPEANRSEQPADQGSKADANPLKADDAFEQFTKAANHPVDQHVDQHADGKKPSENPAQQVTPEDADGAQQTPAKSDDGADDHELDNLPVEGLSKDFRRALKSRGELKKKAATLEHELTNERTASDRLFARFEAAGIEPDTLPQFLGHLGRAKHGDAAAKDYLRQYFGIESAAAPTTSGYTEEQVRDAIALAMEHYDPERAIAVVKAKAGKPRETEAPASPVTPQQPQQTRQPTQPQAVQPQQPQPQVRAGEYGMPELKAEMNGMAAVLRTTYGPRANEVTAGIEQVVQKELQRFSDLGIQVPPKGVAKLYQEAFGAVQARQASARQTQPTNMRSSKAQATSAPRSADEQFEAFVGG